MIFLEENIGKTLCEGYMYDKVQKASLIFAKIEDSVIPQDVLDLETTKAHIRPYLEP